MKIAKICKNCKWWIRIADWGDCRKHAPITIGDTQTGIYNPIWPQPDTHQGCGDFEGRKSG